MAGHSTRHHILIREYRRLNTRIMGVVVGTAHVALVNGWVGHTCLQVGEWVVRAWSARVSLEWHTLLPILHKWYQVTGKHSLWWWVARERTAPVVVPPSTMRPAGCRVTTPSGTTMCHNHINTQQYPMSSKHHPLVWKNFTATGKAMYVKHVGNCSGVG